MTPQERAEFAADIAAALMERQAPIEVLSDDEIRVLKLLINRQEQSIALRQSIIEKSLTSLLVAAVMGVFVMASGWWSAHIYKP